MRVGMSNQKVGYVQIKNLVQRSSKIYWDEKACEEAKLADIDEERVNWFLKEAKHRRGLDIDEKDLQDLQDVDIAVYPVDPVNPV